MRGSGVAGVDPAKYKTRLCEYPQPCWRGDKCAFAHGEKELRRPPSYKTRMCENEAPCWRGASCQFAHSADELRRKPCRYGVRCYNEDCEYSHADD